MKIVILAAGKGSRLDRKDEAPKALTKLSDGRSILQQQLEHLNCYLSLHDVVVVIGYHYEKILAAFPHLLYVYNPDYASENTSKSLLRAVKKIDEDLLFLNGDVVFHPTVIKTLLNFQGSAMIVKNGVTGEEEVKYRSNQEGVITEVSKQVISAQGEAVGINFISKKDLPCLLFHLEQCAATDYFERAIEGCIQEGLQIHALPVDPAYVSEIDFPEDLVHANELIKHWNLHFE